MQNDILAGMLPTGSMLRVGLFVNEEDKEKAEQVLSARYDTRDLEWNK